MQKKLFNKRAYEIEVLKTSKRKVVIVFDGHYEVIENPKPLDFLYIFKKHHCSDFKLITFNDFVRYWHLLCQDEIDKFEKILDENNFNDEWEYSWIYQALYVGENWDSKISNSFFTYETRSKLSELLTSMYKKLANELIKKFKNTKYSSRYFPKKDGNPVWDAPSLVWRAVRFIISKEPDECITSLNDISDDEFEKVVKKSKSLVLSNEKVMMQIWDIVRFMRHIWREKTLLNI